MWKRKTLPPEPVRVVVVGLNRSGTSATMAALRQHPELDVGAVEIRPEFFHQGLSLLSFYNHHPYRLSTRALPHLFDALCQATPGPEAPAARVLKSAVSSVVGAVDMCAGIREFLPDSRIVVVRRRDVVAQMASLKKSQATKVWHSGHGERAASDFRLELDRDELLDYTRRAREIDAQFDLLAESHRVHFVSYEDHVSTGDFAALYGFLGVRPQPPEERASMKKLSLPAAEYVVDYEALCDAAREVAPVSREEATARAVARLRKEDEQRPPSFSIGRAEWYFDHVDRALGAEMLESALLRDWPKPGWAIKEAIDLWLKMMAAGHAPVLRPEIDRLLERCPEPGLLQTFRTEQAAAGRTRDG